MTDTDYLSKTLNADIDTQIYYTDPLTLKTYPSWMVEAVDTLLYKIRHKNIWEIVDFCLQIWARKYPKEHKLYMDEMARHRSSRGNRYASTKGKQLRELVHIPQELSYLLNKIASHKIEEYGTTKFWKDFAIRYPGFRGGEAF